MKCPGQDTQYWNENAIFDAVCPQCNKNVEFFKDDTMRKCSHCGHRFVNPRMDFGCAAYCSYAEQCLGDLPPELVAQRDDLLKDRVAIAVKRHLKADFKQIGRAVRRARHAEEIGKTVQADLPLLLMAAYLWELGDSRAADGTPIAAKILEALKAPTALIDQVCAIVGNHPSDENGGSLEEQILADAHAMALLEEKRKETSLPVAEINDRIQDDCITEAGRIYAHKYFQTRP
jgi:hypothetical protein